MKDKKTKPPGFLFWLIRQIALQGEEHSLSGDIEEDYYYYAEKRGRFYAYIMCWSQVFRSFFSFSKYYFYGSTGMIKSYFKIAFRNIKRNKMYSLLNMLGLAVGMACSILILLYLQYEFSFDRYHKNADNIYRVARELHPGHSHGGKTKAASTPVQLKDALIAECAEVKNGVRIVSRSNRLLVYRNKSYLEDNIIFADPDFFNFFSFQLMKGDPNIVLKDPASIVLSEDMAEKYFGNEDPVGKVINFNNAKDVVVTGIMKNVPANSHFKMNFTVPLVNVIDQNSSYSWGNNMVLTYISLREGADPGELEDKFPSLFKKHYREDENSTDRTYVNHFTQPLTKIHMYSDLDGELSNNNDIRTVLIIASIAFLILIIACINYMNLATARSVQRSREVGVRKVVGAQRKQLIRQFFSEAAVFTFLALVLSGVLVILVLPFFNNFVDRELSLSLIKNARFLLSVSAVTAVVILFAGSYPALFISSFKPVVVLRGSLSGKSKGSVLRNILVVFQFSISIMLIISTFVVKDQLSFLRNTDVGYTKDQVVIINLRDRNVSRNLEAVKTELKRSPDVIAAGSSSFLPYGRFSQTQPNFPGKPEDFENFDVYVGRVDHDYVDLYDIKLADGRNFSRDFPSDKQAAFLFNESLANRLGWDPAVGKEYMHWGRKKGKVVGVMKDFHFHTLHRGIEPMYLFFEEGMNFYYLSVKIKGTNIPGTMEYLQEKMRGFSPNYPFEYSFFDEVFDRAYRTEIRMEKIFSVFAYIAIFVACLGLFGLASFTAEQKTKEIGVRKVLGAGASNIIILLSKEFTKWVLFANLIAWPASYFIMNMWLRNFAFRTNISIDLFLLASGIALFIALLTVSTQSVKAARTDPVKSLKYE